MLKKSKIGSLQDEKNRILYIRTIVRNKEE